jgi:hypothetical protein
MTKDEILSMAKAAGFPEWWFNPPEIERKNDEALNLLFRFAALVAEKERAKIVTLLKGSLDEDEDADLWYLAIKCMIEKIEKVDAA